MNTSSAEFCRQIETYMCRKNDGHLIRIVGPAFEQVCGWAERGVPLRVACNGIDRFFERYYAKGPRRRPVRIEFCEADVLDAFDEWRRAVGVTLAGATPAAKTGGSSDERSGGRAPEQADSDTVEESSGRRLESLPVHLDRTIARLTAVRGGGDPSLDQVLDAIVRELDAVRAGAKGLRGTARDTLIERLRALDAHLLESARTLYRGVTIDELRREADAELAPFRARMPRDVYDRACNACMDRLIRERLRLPTIAYD